MEEEDGDGHHPFFSLFNDEDDDNDKKEKKENGLFGEFSMEKEILSLPLQMRVHILSGQELDRTLRERSRIGC